MSYQYTITEKDLKEAIKQSSSVLPRFKRRHLLFSFVYPTPLLLFMLNFDKIKAVILGLYGLVVAFFYFYYYPILHYWTIKSRLNKPRKWQDKKRITLVDNHILVTTNGVEQMYDWEQIEKVYETKENIILYLTGKQLNFIIVKKPRNKDASTETTQFFSSFKRKLQEFNLL